MCQHNCQYYLLTCRFTVNIFRSILISRFSYAENLLHFNLADFPAAYQITAVTLMVMGNSKNLCVFNFVILFKSRKFDAREMYVCYSRLSFEESDIQTNWTSVDE